MLNLFAKVRNHQISWGRSLIVALAVVWLNIALQPCAIALNVSSPADDCTHCSDAMGWLCGESHTGDCTGLDFVGPDARSAQIKSAQFPTLTPIHCAQNSAANANGTSASAQLSQVYQPPAINILNCVDLK